MTEVKVPMSEVPLGAPAEGSSHQTYIDENAETPPGTPTGVPLEQYAAEQKEVEDAAKARAAGEPVPVIEPVIEPVVEPTQGQGQGPAP